MTDELLLVPTFLSLAISEAMAEKPMTLPGDGRADVNAYDVYPASLMDAIVHRTSDALAGHFGITEPLFCDYAAASMMTPGMSHTQHADNETADGHPNHTAWRIVTAMLYLNDNPRDFEGGELVFPRIGQTVTPKPGLLVGFRCDGVHTHEVAPVILGVRRALAMWFTHDLGYLGVVAPV